MRAPREEDIDALVSDMRPLDRQELEASHGADIRDAVVQALKVSPHRWAMEKNGQLALLGGFAVISLLGGTASPWMLGTTVALRAPAALTRIAVEYVTDALGRYPHMINYVDARNTPSIRWLRRLGFTVSEQATPYGAQCLPFYRFEMRRTHV